MRAVRFLAFAWLMAVGQCQSASNSQGSQGVQGSQGGQGEGKQLIMLEIERLNYPDEDKVVKRQAEVRYGGSPGQYVVQTSDQGGAPQQVPPEYLSLLQQLSPQPSQPHNIQQLFISRGPQGSFSQFQTPQPAVPQLRRLTPQQEEMRRLQEHEANKHIREQQERALQRAQQTGQFQPGFQPGLPPQQQPQPPQYQPQFQQQYQQQPQQYQPQQPDPQDYPQYEASSLYAQEPQYSQPSSAPQYYQTRSIRPSQVPEKFSYSEVKFGSSDIARETLEPRLVSIEQRLQNQVRTQPQYYQVQAQPQHKPQPQPQPQPEPQRQVDYSPFSVQQPQQQTPTQPQHPEQYLIETTRPAQNEDNVVRIPRPRPPPQSPQSLYYRPDPPVAETLYAKAPEPYTTIPQAAYQAKGPEPYTTIPLAVYNQVPIQYTPAPEYRSAPQGIPLPSPDAPSRSAIYVHQTSIGKRITTQPPSYTNYPGYSQGVPRIPTPHGQRPLTSSEIKALSKAGFQISPLALNSLQESSEISPTDEEDSEEYKTANSKRQSFYLDERKPPGKYPKRIPKPVPLTETERKLLAEQGIRNLYRVESSESKDAPVTYVLAIDNSMVRKRESEESTDGKN